MSRTVTNGDWGSDGGKDRECFEESIETSMALTDKDREEESLRSKVWKVRVLVLKSIVKASDRSEVLKGGCDVLCM